MLQQQRKGGGYLTWYRRESPKATRLAYIGRTEKGQERLGCVKQDNGRGDAGGVEEGQRKKDVQKAGKFGGIGSGSTALGGEGRVQENNSASWRPSQLDKKTQKQVFPWCEMLRWLDACKWMLSLPAGSVELRGLSTRRRTAV